MRQGCWLGSFDEIHYPNKLKRFRISLIIRANHGWSQIVDHELHVSHHQQKNIWSAQNCSTWVDMLCYSCQRYPGGDVLYSWPQYLASHRMPPSDRSFTIFSSSVCLQFQTNTLALWPTVTIRRNGFLGYTLASGLQCNGWHFDNVSSGSFHLRAKCNHLFTNYTHQSKSPDLCGYWQSVACSVHLVSCYL